MDRLIDFKIAVDEFKSKPIKPLKDKPAHPSPPVLSHLLHQSNVLIKDGRKLELFIEKIKPRYLDFGLLTTNDKMSDSERDGLDSEIRMCLAQLTSKTNELEASLNSENTMDLNDSYKTHFDCALQYLRGYMKQLKAKFITLCKSREKIDFQTKYWKLPKQNKKEDTETDTIEPQKKYNLPEEKLDIDENQSKILQQENQLLQNTLFSMDNEVRDIMHKLTEIDDLTKIMAEKVDTDAEILGNILDDSMTSHQHIIKGNSNLKQLKTDTKDIRLFLVTLIMFFSFSLLFLHAVNP